MERTRKLERTVPKQPRAPEIVDAGNAEPIVPRGEGFESAKKAAIRNEVKGRVGAYGAPTGSGMLHLLSDPVGAVRGVVNPEAQTEKEFAERQHQEEVAQTPEVTDIRKEYGAMSAPARSVVAPLARGGAGVLELASGLSRLGGLLPKGVIPPADRLSEWAKKRAEIIQAGAANAPLREQQTLSSLITGHPELEEIQRSVPEKIATGIADLGVGIGSVILLKKATGLPFNQLLALEAAVKASDKPAVEQLAAAGQGYAMGTALSRI